MKIKSRITALVLLAVMLVSLVPAIPASAYSKATYDDIKNSTTEELKAQIDELNALLEETQKSLDEAEELQTEAQAKRELYLTLESLYEDTLGTMEDELLLIETEAQNIADSIAKTETEYQKDYADFLEMLKIIYEEGTPNYLEIIMGAESFSDLLSRVERLRSVLGYGNTLMKNLTAEKQELTEAYNEQLALAAEKEESIAVYEKKQEELAAWKAENEAEITALEKEISDLVTESQNYGDRTDLLDAEFQELVSELEEEENQRRAEEAEKARLAALAAEESRKAAEEQARLKALEEASRKSRFMWPVPMDENVITSVYGSRYHPVYKKWIMHYGIDIACYRDTPIYAAKGGTVVAATYHASYGYYVLINHLDGTSTLYAHCNTGSLRVKKGDTVEQGQWIAGVGTTGVSTGYHLHFELRINGSCVDPLGTTDSNGVKLLIQPSTLDIR